MLRYADWSEGLPPILIEAFDAQDVVEQFFPGMSFELHDPQVFYKRFQNNFFPEDEPLDFNSAQEFVDFLLKEGILQTPNPDFPTGPR